MEGGDGLHNGPNQEPALFRLPWVPEATAQAQQWRPFIVIDRLLDAINRLREVFREAEILNPNYGNVPIFEENPNSEEEPQEDDEAAAESRVDLYINQPWLGEDPLPGGARRRSREGVLPDILSDSESDSESDMDESSVSVASSSSSRGSRRRQREEDDDNDSNQESSKRFRRCDESSDTTSGSDTEEDAVSAPSSRSAPAASRKRPRDEDGEADGRASKRFRYY